MKCSWFWGGICKKGIVYGTRSGLYSVCHASWISNCFLSSTENRDVGTLLHELQLVLPFGASCIDSVMAVLILVIRFPKIILQFCLLYWGYIWKWNGGKTRKRHRVCPVVEIFGVLTTRVLYPVPDQLKKPIKYGDIAPWPIWNNLSIWLVAIWIETKPKK